MTRPQPTKLPFCVQCKDQDSGKTGTFCFDPKKGKTAGNFHAASPVFDNLAELIGWGKANNVALEWSDKDD